MGELRQRARELAEKLDRDLNSQKSFTVDPVIHIESALLRFAVEVLKAEPDEGMIRAAGAVVNESTYNIYDHEIQQCWSAMAAERVARMKGATEGGE